MTVISALISKICTSHACDSFITAIQPSGDLVLLESRKTKIVPVKQWNGALSYWGLASNPIPKWDTYDWLCRIAQTAGDFASAEDFGNALASKLTEALFTKGLGSGIGVHFTAYERFHDLQIPELFLISNWTDTNYKTFSELTITREPNWQKRGQCIQVKWHCTDMRRTGEDK